MNEIKAAGVIKRFEDAKKHFDGGRFQDAYALLDPLDERAGLPERQLYAAALYSMGEPAKALPLLCACLAERPEACSNRAWGMALLGLTKEGEFYRAADLFAEAAKAGKVTLSLCVAMLDLLCVEDDAEKLVLAERVFPHWERLSDGKRRVRRYDELFVTSVNSSLRDVNKSAVSIPADILELFEILVPTFNRRDTILAFLEEIFSVSPDLSVLVSDNASEDGTYEAIVKRFGHHKGLRVVCNETNLGYSGNIERLIRESTRRYGIVTSDEDPIVISEIESALRTMRDAGALVMSPLIVKNMRLHRGFTNISDIRPQDFQLASFFTSGLVFQTEFLRGNIDILQKAIRQPQQVYPQQILTCFALLHGRGIWYPRPLCYIRFNLDSFIHKEVEEDRYNGVVGRWRQFRLNVDMVRYLSAAENGGNARIAEIGNKIIEEMARGIMTIVRNGAKREYPELSAVF
jgi:hypothetical protein